MFCLAISIENAIEQLIHPFSCPPSSCNARGKFGEQSKSLSGSIPHCQQCFKFFLILQVLENCIPNRTELQLQAE